MVERLMTGRLVCLANKNGCSSKYVYRSMHECINGCIISSIHLAIHPSIHPSIQPASQPPARQCPKCLQASGASLFWFCVGAEKWMEPLQIRHTCKWPKQESHKKKKNKKKKKKKNKEKKNHQNNNDNDKWLLILMRSANNRL